MANMDKLGPDVFEKHSEQKHEPGFRQRGSISPHAGWVSELVYVKFTVAVDEKRAVLIEDVPFNDAFEVDNYLNATTAAAATTAQFERASIGINPSAAAAGEWGFVIVKGYAECGLAANVGANARLTVTATDGVLGDVDDNSDFAIPGAYVIGSTTDAADRMIYLPHDAFIERLTVV